MLYYRIYRDKSEKTIVLANMVTHSESDYTGLEYLGRLYTSGGDNFFVISNDLHPVLDQRIRTAVEQKFGINLRFYRADSAWDVYTWVLK